MITYSDSVTMIAASQIGAGFFGGWPNPPTAETHLRILRQSQHVVVARSGVDGPVVGFITAISDGVLSAYIPLLEVLPEYRNQGIGRELTRRMLDMLSTFYMVDLVCDADLEPFYGGMGMIPLRAMSRRHYAYQAGRPARNAPETDV